MSSICLGLNSRQDRITWKIQLRRLLSQLPQPHTSDQPFQMARWVLPGNPTLTAFSAPPPPHFQLTAFSQSSEKRLPQFHNRDEHCSTWVKPLPRKPVSHTGAGLCAGCSTWASCPANGQREAVEDGLSVCALASTWGRPTKLLAPAFHLTQAVTAAIQGVKE